MNNIKISFCIPTYNRSSLLSELIGSIVNQVRSERCHEIEICVSDNDSSDDTALMIAEWQARSAVRIVYSKSEVNVGPDLNYMRAVELASGEYCWYFGSDDILAVGALDGMLSNLLDGADIYLCNRVACDIAMNRIDDEYWLAPTENSKRYNFSDEIDLINYLNSAKDVGALFSFLSSIVFRRERWNAIELDPSYIGSAYSHVYKLLKFRESGCDFIYLKDHFVLCRGGNDTFMEKGILRRIFLDYDGYLKLARDIFEVNGVIYVSFLAVLRRHHPALRTLRSIVIRAEGKEWKGLKATLVNVGYNSMLCNLFWWASPFLRVAYFLKMATKR
jgi:abequosyltransferase